MKAWYCPSWNGDWRLEPDPKNEELTRISMEKPTARELELFAKLAPVFLEKSWITSKDADKLVREPKFWKFGRDHVVLAAPITDVGPVVTSFLQPGVAILTAVRFKNGQIEVAATNKPDEVKAIVVKKEVEKAVTVKRATPCCPTCYVDAVAPATDVLLSFVDEEQHASWAKNRLLVVRGGVTKHRYLLAHRHSPLARAQMRIAFDLDDREVMHFHDWTVPPEEEILSAMLILRHREPWLRNEATALGGSRRHVFKNPFGDGLDGVVDSLWTRRVGVGLLLALSP